MASYEQKTQINKDEVIHDLNNLNYLLRALAKMIESTPALPREMKRLSLGAITATDRLIAKLSGNSKPADNSNSTSNQVISKNSEEPKK
jgi:hypothetical protein